MNEIQNSLIAAMEMMATNSVSNSNATITIKAEIVEIINPSRGIYKARYLSDAFEVYASAGLEYAVGSMVYVLVPDGDFNKEKLIVGSAGAAYESAVQIGESDQYYEISDNLLTTDNIALCSYKPEEKEIPNEEIAMKLDIDNLNSCLSDGGADTICFSLTLTTHLDQEQQRAQGHYGAALTFLIKQKYVEDDSSTIEETLELSTTAGTILGNPYAVETPAIQYYYYSIDGNTFEVVPGSAKIKYYCKDFHANEEKTLNDIFFSNINVSACKKILAGEDQGYGLYIRAEKGRTFSKDEKAEVSKKIIPDLRYKGVKINNKSLGFVQWFIEDETVEIGGEGYSKSAGAGWRSLNEINDNGVISMPELDLKRPTGYKTKYKCAVVYDEAINIAEFTIINLASKCSVAITSTTGSTEFVDGPGLNVTLQASVRDSQAAAAYIFNWSRLDKTGRKVETKLDFSENSPIEENEGIYICSQDVSIPTAFVDKANTFKCTVLRDPGKGGALVNLGTAELTITVGPNQEYRLEINQNRVFKYDGQGNAPTSPSYKGPAASLITSIEPLVYKIYKPDGTEFDATEYGVCKYTWSVPKNSLIQLDSKVEIQEEDAEYYYIKGVGNNGEGIPFTISSRYNTYKAEISTIKLEVDFNGKILQDTSDIIFLKDGENGTNGTSYSAVVTYNDFVYNQFNNTNLIMCYDSAKKEWYYIKDNTLISVSSSQPFVNTKVYLDGEEVNSGYTVKYSWFDEQYYANPCLYIDNGIIYANSSENAFKEPSGEEVHIIRAEVSIKGYKLYAYYPIEVIYMASKPDDINILPKIEGGFTEVLYSSSRNQPMLNGAEVFSCNFDGVNWSVPVVKINKKDKSIIFIKNLEDGLISVSMAQQLEHDNTKAYVKAELGDYSVLRPILVLSNRFDIPEMNNWDGNKVDIGDEYAYAPQFGAGIKNDKNEFTGVYMGKTDKRIGLIGKRNGLDSFFLDAETGRAIFGGSEGGQIIIDPVETEIRWGNGNFYVDKDGYFGFGKDKIKFAYDTKSKKDILTLSDVTLKWDKINSPNGEYADTAEEYFKNLAEEYNNFKDDIQKQVDQKAETWYQDTDPSIVWNINEIKAEHVGDLWHDTVNNKTYVYVDLGDNKYGWQEADGVPDIVFDAIDGKAQVFISEPKPPYNVGDLWVQGPNGNIYRCKTARDSGNYNADDWELASKYTDDTNLNNFKTTVNNILTVGNPTTEIGEDYIISPKIGGGYLFLTANNGKNTVEINPNGTSVKDSNGHSSTAGRIISVKYNNSDVFYVNTSGGAYFAGKIIANSGNIGGCEIDENGKLQVPSAQINGTIEAKQIKVGDIVIGAKQVGGSDTFNTALIPILSADKIDVKDLKAFGAAIGGWTINENSLTSGTDGTDNFIGLYSSYDTKENYRIVVGNKKFTVTRDGTLNATGATIIGTIITKNITVTGGSIKLGDAKITSTGIVVDGSGSSKIGGWNVGLSSLYSGLSSTTGTSLGTYIGTEGIRQNGPGSNSSCFFLSQGHGFFSGCTAWDDITIVDKFSEIKNFGSTDSINAPMYWESNRYSVYNSEGITVVDETGDDFRAISGMDSQYLYYNTWNSYDDKWTHDQVSLAQILLTVKKVMQNGYTGTLVTWDKDSSKLQTVTFSNGVLTSVTPF